MKNKSTVSLSPFEQLVKKALKCFDDPQRLGEESPLASHYFLGAHFLAEVQIDSEPASDALARGKALCRAMRQAAARLWGEPLPKDSVEMKVCLKEVRKLAGTARYAYLVLELRCFQDYFNLPRTADIWENDDYLPGSQSAHYRDFDLAVVYLANALLDQLYPTLRFEQPKSPATLMGYQSHLERIVKELALGKTVALSGAGGTGKSALAANVVQMLATDEDSIPAFWFAVRPKFNDHLNSLLFALGHFLHSHGGSHLWQTMVAASNGTIVPDVALALARQDLAALDRRKPLLCFDDFDLLFAADPENEATAHRQIIEFVEGLRGDCPLLVIGQRPLLESDSHIHLEGLAVIHIAELFQLHHQPLSSEEANQIHQFTRGNPRMVLLCMALQQSGESLAETIHSLPQSPALASLLHRLWRRLSGDERRMLQRLSVFRRAAPVMSDQLDPKTLQQLIARQLIHVDRHGGIELLPALRTRIYDELSPDLRLQLHLEAAEVRLLHGEYTAAAYHFWHGHNPSGAIQNWYPKRAAEIKRGQAGLAWEIFTHIPHLGLPKEESQMLSLIQAELYKLRGDLEQGLASMEKQDWSGNQSANQSSNQSANIEATILHGEFLEMLGQPAAAQKSLRRRDFGNAHSPAPTCHTAPPAQHASSAPKGDGSRLA